jgi:hypothetical protein
MQPSVGDIVSSEMDESEPVPIQVPRDNQKQNVSSQHVSSDSNSHGLNRAQSLRTSGVETAVAYRVTNGDDPVPVLVIPDSSQNGSQSDWRAGAQVVKDFPTFKIQDFQESYQKKN